MNTGNDSNVKRARPPAVTRIRWLLNKAMREGISSEECDTTLLPPSPDPKEMGTCANDRRLPFERPRHVQEIVALDRVVPSPVKIRQHPARALDAQGDHVIESRSLNFPNQILRPMEVCGREVVDLVRVIPMLAFKQIPVPDRPERGILREPSCQPIQRRGVS